MDPQSVLREHVLNVLRGGQAHLGFEAAVARLPPPLRGARPHGLAHSPWKLVEHLRTCQWDILRFTVDPAHVSPEFPAGYWPPTDGPPTANDWDRSLQAFRDDFEAIVGLVADPATDLLAPLPHAPGYTVLREALLVADHNAYHLGQLVVVRKLLGAWSED